MLENKLPPSLDSQPGDMLIELVGLLEQIDTNSSLAALNESTISDNNGYRIQL